MSVNNEIGVIQPLSDIGMICRERKVFFHSDAAQALGKIPLVAPALLVDLMSLSGHKIYGPKGIGALYIRRKSRVRLDPLLSGGGQEGGIRSGTLSPALCVGFGEACAIAREELAEESARIVGLSHHFMDEPARPARRHHAQWRRATAVSGQHQSELRGRRRRVVDRRAAGSRRLFGRGLRLCV